MAKSTFPAATNLGGNDGSAGSIISTSKLFFSKKPFCCATMIAAWSGFTYQSSIKLIFSFAKLVKLAVSPIKILK